jgi:hypothetical protein
MRFLSVLFILTALWAQDSVGSSRLVEARRLKGDAAAGQLAEIFASLPTLWK